MTEIDFGYYLIWVHLLAWHTLQSYDLSKVDQKTIGVFINRIKQKKYFQREELVVGQCRADHRRAFICEDRRQACREG